MCHRIKFARLSSCFGIGLILFGRWPGGDDDGGGGLEGDRFAFARTLDEPVGDKRGYRDEDDGDAQLDADGTEDDAQVHVWGGDGLAKGSDRVRKGHVRMERLEEAPLRELDRVGTTRRRQLEDEKDH